MNSLVPISNSAILYDLQERKYISRIYTKDDYQLYITLLGKEYLSDYKYKVLNIILSSIAAVFSVLGILLGFIL